MKYLIDTNIVGELVKTRRNPGVSGWWDQVAEADVHISVITLGEIRKGVERLLARNPEQAVARDAWLQGLAEAFRGRIEGVDADIALTWGRLCAMPRTPPIDALLAATVIVRGWTLVTRNVRTVEQTGCLVLNPFT